MSIEIHDSDLIAMLMRLDYDNWFQMLPPIADRFREIGEAGYADRVEDFIVERKRPQQSKYGYTWRFETSGYGEWFLWSRAVAYIDYENGQDSSESIRQQLLGYLQIPEELRIPRKTIEV